MSEQRTLSERIEEATTEVEHGVHAEEALRNLHDLATEVAALEQRVVESLAAEAAVRRVNERLEQRVAELQAEKQQKQLCIDNLREQLASRTAADEALVADKERLDWLEREGAGLFEDWLKALKTIYPPDGDDLRSALDAARLTVSLAAEGGNG